MSDKNGNGDNRSLDAKVAAIESEVSGLKADVAGIRGAIERLADAGRPKRESLTAWLSVVVALASLLLWGAVREVDRINSDAKERDRDIDARAIALDVRLQREMRDLDATMIERIDGLRERVDRVQASTEGIWKVAIEQIPQNKEADGRLDERVRALERNRP